jgi:hypothetical protein
VLARESRVIGRHDEAQALANVAGGYMVIDAATVRTVMAEAKVRAETCARDSLKLPDPKGYARENWAIFAGQILIERGAKVVAGKANRVDWRAIDKKRQRERRRGANTGGGMEFLFGF